MVLQKISRIDQLNTFTGQFIRDAADQRISIALWQFQKHFEHARVRNGAAEDLHVLDLAGHDRFVDACGFEETEHLAELANAYPGQMLSQAFNRRVSLFANGGHSYGSTGPASALKHKERKPAVACY